MKGDEKRGGNANFFPIGEKYAYFFPNSLKVYKIEKQGWKFFACGAHPLIVIYFSWGKNINQERGGGANIGISNLIYTPECMFFYVSPCKYISFGGMIQSTLKSFSYVIFICRFGFKTDEPSSGETREACCRVKEEPGAHRGTTTPENNHLYQKIQVHAIS